VRGGAATSAMALSGLKKKKDGAPDAGASAPAKPAKVVKEKKARPPKPALKNGVMVGLNIGNAAIKAVEVTAKAGQLSVSRLATIPTPPDAYQNGNVLSVSALANALKALWKAGGFKGKAVVSSVAGTGALVVRVIEVPLMTDAQLADAMRADAQLYIPFPPTEVQMDFKALRDLPRDPDAATMDVLLAAAQSEIIDLHIKALQAGRLDPRAVDVEPIAAGRALSYQKRIDAGNEMPDYNEISAIANIGAFGTEISLLRGDVLVFTRSVSAGGNSLSQAIADALTVPLSEGERLKIEQGDALAPEGYGAMTDDFGFGGDFGEQSTGFGGEFDDFGLNQAPASGQAPNMTTVLDAPAEATSPAPASSDPFDLDFFDQGPKDEPGAGHGQKEGEPPINPFDFEDDTLLPTIAPTGSQNQTPSQAATTSPQAAPTEAKTPTFNFDFDLPPQDLPSTQTPTTSTFGATGAPANVSGAPGAALPSAGGVAGASAPVASAFDFSDFDLPSAESEGAGTPTTLTSTPVAPSVAAPPAETSAFSEAPRLDVVPLAADLIPSASPVAGASDAGALPEFSFDAAPDAGGTTSPATAPTTAFAQPLTLSDEILPDTSATLSQAAAPIPDAAFDLDAVFGAPEVPSTNIPVATNFSPDATAENFLDTSLLPEATTPMATTPASDGLALEGLNVDMAGFGLGDAGDIGDFGVGLSGAGNSDSSVIYGALAPALEELASEIARSLSFYLERVPDAALSRVYLTGGGALLKNLDVYLTGRLGAPTSVFNPLQMLPVSAPVSPLTTQGPVYTVALGLALRDFVD